MKLATLDRMSVVRGRSYLLPLVGSPVDKHETHKTRPDKEQLGVRVCTPCTTDILSVDLHQQRTGCLMALISL